MPAAQPGARAGRRPAAAAPRRPPAREIIRSQPWDECWLEIIMIPLGRTKTNIAIMLRRDPASARPGAARPPQISLAKCCLDRKHWITRSNINSRLWSVVVIDCLVLPVTVVVV